MSEKCLILTKKQQAIYSYMLFFFQENHFSPTTREVGEKFGITVKGAYDHMTALRKKGFISGSENKGRGIKYLHLEVKLVSIHEKNS